MLFIHMEWHQISCKGKMTQFEIIVKLLAAFSVMNLKEKKVLHF